MLKYMEVEQNTDDWMQLRAGRITGSSIGKIMANYGKAFGSPAKDYAVKIALERITGQVTGGSFSNIHTERGHEQEPIARSIYERDNLIEVSDGGFFCNDTLGCSPDGLVGEDGVIEIKSVIGSVHYAAIKRGTFDPKYKWQLISNLMFTGRDWIDFISYCSEFPEGCEIFTCRIEAGKCNKEFEMIANRIDEFESLVSEVKKTILNSNYHINK